MLRRRADRRLLGGPLVAFVVERRDEEERVARVGSTREDAVLGRLGRADALLAAINIRRQPPSHTVTASITYGDSLAEQVHTWPTLQPLWSTVTASMIYGYSL